MRVIKPMMVMMSCLLILWLFPSSSEAEEGTPLTLNTILPENQVNPTADYFDLLMTPGQEQVLEIEVTNSTDQDTTVAVQMSAVRTNNYGQLDYGVFDTLYDDSLAYPFPTLATADQTKPIKANSKERVKVTVTMPEEVIQGIIVGGISLTEVRPETEEKDAQEGVKLANSYAYTIGVVLRESTALVPPVVTLKQTRVDEKKESPVVLATIQNNQPAVINDMTYHYKIYSNKSNQLVYENKQQRLRLAPNSQFEFSMPLEGKTFDKGEYRLELTVKGVDEQKKAYDWQLRDTFKLTTAYKGREGDDAGTNQPGFQWRSYVMMGVLVVLFLMIGWLGVIIMRQKKRLAATKKGKDRRKKKRGGKNR